MSSQTHDGSTGKMLRLKPSRMLLAVFLVLVPVVCFLVSSIVRTGERGYDILTDLSCPVFPTGLKLSAPEVRLGKPCSPFSNGGMNGTTIVIKLGAPEMASKLPSYLKGFGPCKPDLLLFSDRKGSIDGIEIVDTLEHLPSDLKQNNPDFDIYREMQLWDTKESFGRTVEGWKLDKYKFLPMMELTANLRPNSSWVVFIELDTYVNWDNLYRFLKRFDSMEGYYFGSPVWPKKKTIFAHGGSGFVLSQGALRKLSTHRKAFANAPGTHLFGKNMQNECCGDEVLAQVLREVGVKLKGYWPMFNGEKQSSIPFGNEHWCEAIITLHHLGEDDFEMMHRFESYRQYPQTPLTFQELFGYIEPSLADQVEDWSNLSEDVVLEKGNVAGKSFEACFNACLADSKCIQCEHSGDTCRLSHSIRLGHKKLRWTSGWVKARLDSFKTIQPKCHGGARIVHSNP